MFHFTTVTVVIDGTTKKATSDRPRRFESGLTTRLEDAYFADDRPIGLHSHSSKGSQEKTDKVDSTARAVGLKIHLTKTKRMQLNAHTYANTILIEEIIEKVNDFKYLDCFIWPYYNIEKEISTMIGVAPHVFNRLIDVWKSATFNTKTKPNIYKSNICSVIPHAYET